ncbi:sulfonate ABC transporter substrate-binding protein [Achromobacter xylosoxidans]|uniref:sulfonate ABC transporter substrate-binding protein n=1 Tax=Alcaligenes xylosoxydans xylosoxydans TaxID=85698 RepID=UPI0006AC334F|nr:sulfonate ABC transporter substrate-binding protein [Achromobacter xylosoxidans]KOQ22258.1 ABC transporter substrate-binding protein [Achromobacter xylosoxidans]KOQ22307.1 ABC transporter substrate-binding protein [Achromobacter xylosoxidans]KOQ29938.1 ABC transporter substrate-binding protein [Achromobacter xylosoxidans]KOQ41118.1 ABC transporter substrate-binding protein [Achromobacter xylosoxidans]KOQ41698.1 ABC transporter substrate-binding protein [Achromobacter xylosoxidans]
MRSMIWISRLSVFRWLAALLCAALLWPAAQAQAQEAKTLRIGFQKYGTLTIVRALGDLDKRLAAQGITVKWTEFPAGPQLLEGLNVGSIDFGTVGEAPPVFAQAAGAALVYVGNEPPSPTSEAILVPKDSPIKRVADLKGKKVALNKGSNVHYLLVKQLERAGVPYADVNVAYLTPADARAAFERGSVDAWVIWDPFQAAAEKQLGARVLADGTGVVKNYQFFLAARPYQQAHPEVIQTVLEEIRKGDLWARDHRAEAVALLQPVLGLDKAVVELAAERLAYGVQPITREVLLEQQQVADAFHALKLIPRPLNVFDAAPSGLK